MATVRWLLIGCVLLVVWGGCETPEGRQALDTAIEVTSQQASQWLPGPYNAIVPAVIGLAVGLARAWHNRNTAKNIVKSIEAAKCNGPNVNFHDPKTMHTINLKMSKSAKSIVDSVQGKRKILPL